jgi:hypothetical protein
MIESVLTKGMWVESTSTRSNTHTATIYIGNDSFRRPRVTAEIAISRFAGSGTAKAYIWSYEYQPRFFDPELITQMVEPPLADDDPLRLIKGLSQDTFNNASSVTFGVTVTDMFVFANCTVFVYQSTSVADILFRPIRFLRDLLAGISTTKDGPIKKSGSSQMTETETGLVYDRETGEILHVHEVTLMQGGKLPNEKDLKASVISLTRKSINRPGTDMDVIFVQEELVPGKKYRVDVQGKRLFSSNGDKAT